MAQSIPSIPGTNVAELGINWATVRSIALRYRWRWIFSLLVSAILAALYGLFMLPQSFSAQSTFSVVQSGGMASSSLLSMAGIGGSKTSTIGVLKSQYLAEQVEEHAHLGELYGITGREKIAELYKKGLNVEDNQVEGLTKVTFSLKGPARLERGKESFREKVKEACATVANLYTRELMSYLKDGDTDREATLLRQATNEVTKARQEYEGAVLKLKIPLLKSRMGDDAAAQISAGVAPSGSLSAGGGMGGGTTAVQAMGAPTEIQSLYIRRGQIEEQLQAMEAGNLATKNLLGGNGADVQNLPDEDPLLMVARDDVTTASKRLEELRITYGEENPRVRDAKEKLRLAQTRLKNKVQAYKMGRNSKTVKLTELLASREAVRKEIARAERTLAFGRILNFDFETQKANIALRLEVLKTVSSRFAEMRISMVSGQNRMRIVDKAYAPVIGNPGIATVSVVSFVAGLAVVAVWFGLTYIGLVVRDGISAEGQAGLPETAAAP